MSILELNIFCISECQTKEYKFIPEAQPEGSRSSAVKGLGGGRQINPEGSNFRIVSRAVSPAAFWTESGPYLGPFGIIFLSFFDILRGQKPAVNFT